MTSLITGTGQLFEWNVSSTDKLITETTEIFSVPFPFNREPTHIKFKNCEIPLTYYNVLDDTQRSNRLDIMEGLTPFYVYIPNGVYLHQEFAELLQGILNTYSPSGFVYNVLYNSISRVYVITCDNIFSILFVTGPNSAQSIWAEMNFAFADLVGSNIYTSASPFLINEGTIIIRDFGENNNLSISEFLGGGTVTLTLSPGNYTRTTFTAALKSALDAISPNGLTYTVTFDSTTSKYTISTTSLFNILSATGPLNGNDLSELIGIDPIANKSGSTTYIADNISNLSGNNFLYINSTMVVGKSQGILTSNFGDKSVITKIPLDKSYGEIQIYENDTEDFINIQNFPNLNSRIYFWLSNHGGERINLNGSNWSVQMSVYY